VLCCPPGSFALQRPGKGIVNAGLRKVLSRNLTKTIGTQEFGGWVPALPDSETSTGNKHVESSFAVCLDRSSTLRSSTSFGKQNKGGRSFYRPLLFLYSCGRSFYRPLLFLYSFWKILPFPSQKYAYPISPYFPTL